MTQYTPNYKLDLYEDSDKPNLRGQYNAAITEIDKIMFGLSNGQVTINNNIATINNRLDGLDTEVGQNLADITAMKGDIEGAQTNISALQETTRANAEAIQANTTTIDENKSSISSLETTVAEQAERITAATSTANAANTKATQAQQESAKQAGYWNALGVSTLDEAVDLNTDIQDTYTTAMKNQADIALIDILNWDVEKIDGTVSSSNVVLDGYLFKNKSNSLFKFAGRILVPASTTVNWHAPSFPDEPALLIKQNFLDNVTEPMVYNGCGAVFSQDVASYGFTAQTYTTLVIDTDGSLYAKFPWMNTTSTYTLSASFIQIPLTLRKLPIGYNDDVEQ